MKKAVFVLCSLLFITGLVAAQTIKNVIPSGGNIISNFPISIRWLALGTTNKFKVILFKNGMKVGVIQDDISAGNGTRSIPWPAGQYIGGTSAVALLGANDLRGLNGEPLVPINPGDVTTNPGFDRWVGGMGHELGHAFGLDHPAGSPGGPNDDCLMYLGYLAYPDTYLRLEDKTHLMGSGFFSPAIPSFPLKTSPARWL